MTIPAVIMPAPFTTDELTHISQSYAVNGYCVLRQAIPLSDIVSLRAIIQSFQTAWIADNLQLYREEAFNSSLITGSHYLNHAQRLALFRFISSPTLSTLAQTLLSGRAAFMNTQLFFNPQNPEQKTFWHRDCQYDFGIEEQKHIMQNTQVLHIRIPLYPEHGMELIGASHKRWDTDHELNVREELNGHKSDEPLPNSTCIALEPGDILVFAADMIHRGLYGLERLALDILLFDSDDAKYYCNYVDDDCLPTKAMLAQLMHPEIFSNTLNLKRDLYT